jgi:hypothetical protein
LAGSTVQERVVGRWTVPLKGVLRGLPPYAYPEDALYDGYNVVLRTGGLEARPGLTVFNPQSLGGRVIGAIAYTSLSQAAFDEDAFDGDAFQTTSAGVSSLLVAITPSKVWTFYGGEWHDITGSVVFTAGAFDIARMTGIQLTNNIYVIITNGIDSPVQWDSASVSISGVSGSPPRWTDICTASDRIIGIVPPYTVRWGNALTLDTWPAANFRVLSDTLDPVVAIRNLGTLGVVVYKSESIWIGQPGGNTNASYFQFAIRGFWDGPASPSAVVDVDGAHFYMTNLGRVGYFDGSRHDWVGDGVWPQVKAELDEATASHIFGVFDPTNREVYFYYPRQGDAGLCKGLVVVKVPNKAEVVDSPIAFRGRLSFPVSSGFTVRTDSRVAIVFGDEDKVAYAVKGPRDGSQDFSGFFRPGFMLMPGLDPYRLEAFETFAERRPGYGALTAKVVKNDLLENPDTVTTVETDTIQLEEVVPVQPRAGDVRGRFLGLLYEFTTPIKLRWYGARLAARRIEPSVPPGRALV